MLLNKPNNQHQGFGHSWDCLKEPNFSPAWKRMMNVIFSTAQSRKHMQLMSKALQSLPDRVSAWLVPDLALAFEAQRLIHVQVTETMQEKPEKTEAGEAKTIFHEIMNGNGPPQERSYERLCDEGLVLHGAGTETTAAVLTALTFHIASSPTILAKLREELGTVMGPGVEPVALQDLESLEYLVRLTLG